MVMWILQTAHPFTWHQWHVYTITACIFNEIHKVATLSLNTTTENNGANSLKRQHTLFPTWLYFKGMHFYLTFHQGSKKHGWTYQRCTLLQFLGTLLANTDLKLARDANKYILKNIHCLFWQTVEINYEIFSDTRIKMLKKIFNDWKNIFTIEKER